MKKTWESPKLIVLVRGQPQENILSFCKGMGGSVTDPGNVWWYCTLNNAECSCCSTFQES